MDSYANWQQDQVNFIMAFFSFVGLLFSRVCGFSLVLEAYLIFWIVKCVNEILEFRI